MKQWQCFIFQLFLRALSIIQTTPTIHRPCRCLIHAQDVTIQILQFCICKIGTTLKPEIAVTYFLDTWSLNRKGYPYDCVWLLFYPQLQYYTVVLPSGFYFSYATINFSLNSANSLKNKTRSYKSFTVLNKYIKAITSLFWLHNVVKKMKCCSHQILWLP